MQFTDLLECIAQLGRRHHRLAGTDRRHIHDLRHTTASWLVGQGVSLPMVGKLLGHTTTVTTARYAHLATDPVREALEKITAAMGRTANA
ncbi:tyrosine-type recombinase/integrase [Pseudomonas sp. LS1212]|uniref:tyrosine-type recombinase/integrase n=1 Tax=Pseudomonas sp. LS1212 TaxID=2972478 RepID=UPI00215D0CE2|nr:tyrosine-type recombinase/integrase [Pseudomonas sp. LS1212]UVJ43641.1 tyrosine-type recombinase/integrase [Pseudomonas sp. LS1212]